MANTNVKKSHSKISPLGWFIKAGFGTMIGGILALLIFLGIGIGLFVIGFILLKKEQKQGKDQQSQGIIITAYILMGLGMLVGLGFGAPVFFDLLMESL